MRLAPEYNVFKASGGSDNTAGAGNSFHARATTPSSHVRTRSSAQGNCSAKSLAGMSPILPCPPCLLLGGSGGRGVQGWGVGEGGGGRGPFIYLAIHCTTTWCFALKGLRTIRQGGGPSSIHFDSCRTCDPPSHPEAVGVGTSFHAFQRRRPRMTRGVFGETRAPEPPAPFDSANFS